MRRSNLHKLKKVILVCLVNILLIVIGLLSDTIGGDLRSWLAENQINPPVIYILILAVVVLTIVVLTVNVLSERDEGENNKSTAENIEPDEKEFFERLKERYDKRYRSKLYSCFELTLEVSEDWNSGKPKTYKFGTEAKISNAIAAVRKAFDDKNRLLIVGDAGSGKTFLLLKLALELLGNEYKAGQKLPVIFNLASWTEEYAGFEDWLIDVLRSGHGVSENLARTLVRKNRISFLLDGLDELARNEGTEAAAIRKKCLDAIYGYAEVRHKLVICCRLDEFVQMQRPITQDELLPAKVEVLDLTKFDVEVALAEAQKEDGDHRASAEHLENVIKSNETLLDVLRTPFYFTTALDVSGKISIKEKDFPKGIDEIKEYLLDRFIESKISHLSNPTNSEKCKAKVKRQLNWFAKLMERKELVTFELSDLQPTDLSRRWFHSLAVGLAGALIVSLVNCLILGITGLRMSLFIGVAVCICGSLYGGLFFGAEEETKSKESAQPSPLPSTRSHWKERVVFGLVVGLFVSLFIGFAVASIYEMSFGSSLLAGLFNGMVGGFLLGCFLYGGLKKNKSPRSIGWSKAVDESYWSYSKKVLVYGLLYSLVGVVIVRLITGVNNGIHLLTQPSFGKWSFGMPDSTFEIVFDVLRMLPVGLGVGDFGQMFGSLIIGFVGGFFVGGLVGGFKEKTETYIFKSSTLKFLNHRRLVRNVLIIGLGFDLVVNLSDFPVLYFHDVSFHYWYARFIINLIIFLAFGLIGGTLYGLVGGFEGRIKTEEIVHLDYSKLLSWKLWEKVISFTWRGMALGFLVGGLCGGFYFGWWMFMANLDVSTFPIGFLSGGIYSGEFFALLGWLTGCLYGIFDSLKNVSKFASPNKTYQRIYGGFAINLCFVILSLLIIIHEMLIIPYYLTGDFDRTFAFISALLLYFLLRPLIRHAIFQHSVLRLCLYLEGLTPLMYARFLNRAAEARILEKEGGHWRFRHQILQKHFANLDH